jgi:prolipoprotein diacylglyceryltransferase
MRHPAQLYEVGFALVVGIFLWRLIEREHVEGDIFKMFMVSYFGFRLGCDFLKPEVRAVVGLSSIQCASLMMLFYYAKDLIRWSGLTKSVRRNIGVDAAPSGETAQ